MYRCYWHFLLEVSWWSLLVQSPPIYGLATHPACGPHTTHRAHHWLYARTWITYGSGIGINVTIDRPLKVSHDQRCTTRTNGTYCRLVGYILTYTSTWPQTHLNGRLAQPQPTACNRLHQFKWWTLCPWCGHYITPSRHDPTYPKYDCDAWLNNLWSVDMARHSTGKIMARLTNR